MAGQFSAHIWTSDNPRFVVSFPYVIYQFGNLLAQVFTPMKEKQQVDLFLISSLLFFIGVLFGYYVVTPLSIRFLGTYTVSAEIFNDFDLSSYTALVRASVLASGIIFELPILVYFLTKLG